VVFFDDFEAATLGPAWRNDIYGDTSLRAEVVNGMLCGDVQSVAIVQQKCKCKLVWSFF
jgi:hypothetical protein